MSFSSPQDYQVASFDPIVDRFESTRLSFTEADALKASHWDQGEDGRLREDLRFRSTPWGRWILTPRLLANDALFQRFVDRLWSNINLEGALLELDQEAGWRHVFCPADPRFVLKGDELRLSASQLSDRPLLEDPGELEKFTTHLPLHTLEATAASEPRGEWGPGAQEQLIETLGWVRVSLPRQRLNDRMFVARIKGHSMDNGRSGLRDGAYAVFALWPDGMQNDSVVLARGSFRDPETGSFAVKKLTMGEAGATGHPAKMALRSLNPDKTRFPDIELAPEDEPRVRIVADLVQPLSGEEYARSPRRKAIPGVRDLRSEEGLEKQADRLRATLARLFDHPPSEEAEAPDEGTLRQAWESRFVLGDQEAGGLMIATTPLAGLPTFVKKLELHSGEFTRLELAVNLRTKPWRVPVPPSTESYEWTAVGFEDEAALQEDLVRLRIDGLPADKVSLFRLDSVGMGQRLSSSSLTPGQRYRLLLPPCLEVPIPLEGLLWELAGGWRVWELVLSHLVPAGLSSQLEALGFELATVGLTVTWTGDPPREYRETRTGERYPCFHPADHPAVIARGLKTAGKGEIAAFVAGRDGMLPLPLPAGEEWFIGLEDFAPGHYVLELVPQRTRHERVSLPFEVDPLAGSWPESRVVLHLGDSTYPLEGAMSVEHDLTELGAEELPWRISAPPLWPIRAAWDGLHPLRLEPVYASEDGQVELSSIEGRTVASRQKEREGELRIDAGELGLLTLRHLRSVSEDEVRRRLRRLMSEQGDVPVQGSGEFQILRKVWLEPICEVLGYSLRDLEAGLLSGLAPGVAAWMLRRRTHEGGDNRWVSVAVLVAARLGTDLKAPGLNTPRESASRLCTHQSLPYAIITDGLRWAVQESGNRFMQRPIDLREALQDDAADLFEDFLSRFVKE